MNHVGTAAPRGGAKLRGDGANAMALEFGLQFCYVKHV